MKFNVFAACVALTSLVLSTTSSNAYEFSNYNFARNPDRIDNTMRIQSQGRASLRSYRFVGRVGGVNFEQVVDLTGYVIDLTYDAGRPDGSRVTVELNGVEAVLPLYDWELLPIVEFADSKYTAVVSILGEGPNPDQFYYIDYHPAFEDTHLGMRLLQSDIVLTDPLTFSEAPTEGGVASYLAGEQRATTDSIRAFTAGQVLRLMFGDYRSWVLTDVDIDPTITIELGTLRVDVEPYYYFWNSANGDMQGEIDRYRALTEKLEPLMAQRDAAYDAYLRAPVGSTQERNAESELQRLDVALTPWLPELDELKDKLSSFEPEVIEVEELTQRVRSNRELLEQLAPFVYDAVDATAQYSAFFRGAKRQNEDDWVDFRDSVRAAVQLEPVETPNQFDKPEEG